MAACGAACLDFDTSEIKIHVVVNHHNMVWFNLIVGTDGSQRIA